MFFSKKHCNFAAEKVVKQIMGTYINIGNIGFQRARNSEYVDKSELIAIINSTLNTERGFTCVTRCRRFGKSMAAKMLNAYYDQSCDSRSLFADLEIAKDSSFEKHLNKYPVIYLDTSDFVTRFHDDTIVEHIDAELKVMEEAKIELINKGINVVDYDVLLPFSKDAIAIASETGAAIVPFAVCGKYSSRTGFRVNCIRFGEAFKVYDEDESHRHLEESVKQLIYK